MLFEAILTELQAVDSIVLPLPQRGEQDYLTLSQYIYKRLPNEDFILIAESFSGGIAAQLSGQQIPNLKGIIFVASFLSSPKRLLASIMTRLPIHKMARLPVASIVYRLFCLGWRASRSTLNQFKLAIEATPSGALRSRLRVIATSKYQNFSSTVPAVYIRALQDTLVPEKKSKEFKVAYSDIVFIELEGPHFILQSKPQAAARAITQAVDILTGKDTEQIEVRSAP
ncbi:alpha/beta fold hydrolase [Microbulbifer sp. SSSA002]|uniref:alpha/beta fold hydrolase n=1 Tax=unclassified Microbulbifer TaxID=2619833 RepID=UPI004039861B